MKFRTFVIGYVLALALFLFAQHRTETVQPAAFHSIVDLTRAADPKLATRLDAPARLVLSMWTVDKIPAERLVAPLVVLDVSPSARNRPDYQITVEDISAWEQAHGEMPQGAVVMARTGLASSRKSAVQIPGYSPDAAKFLVEGRHAVGLGIDTLLAESGAPTQSAVYQYALAHSVYLLKNVANLDRVPANGAIAMVAPTKLPGALEAPVRVMALVR
jgi:kynurenine formamidase